MFEGHHHSYFPSQGKVVLSNTICPEVDIVIFFTLESNISSDYSSFKKYSILTNIPNSKPTNFGDSQSSRYNYLAAWSNTTQISCIRG